MIAPLAVLLSSTLALAAVPVTTPAGSSGAAESRDAVAVEAFAAGQDLAARGRFDEAIAKLDLASALEPSWAAPVELRAEIFGKLAERYEPSRAFTAARANELERLIALQPTVDPERRRNEVVALRQQSKAAAELERKRRKLVIPAGALVVSSIGFLTAGVLLHSMKPRDALEPGAYRQERRDRAGIALMTIGAVLAPPAIVLAVLAGRQAKRDSATRDFGIEAGRARSEVAVAPTLFRRGAGLGLALRF